MQLTQILSVAPNESLGYSETFALIAFYMDYFDWALSVSRKRLRPSSRKVYASMWKGFVERLALESASPGKESVEQLGRAIEGAGDYVTQQRLYRLICWVYEVLAEAGHPLTDHTASLRSLYLAKVRHQHEGLSDADIATLVRKAEETVSGWKGVRLGALMSVVGYLGLKQQEIIALDKDHLVWGGEQPLKMRVGKAQKSRVLDIPPACGQALVRWLAHYPAPKETEALFVANERGERMDASTIWRQIKRLCEQVFGAHGLTQFGTGVMRASRAKTLEQQGNSSIDIQAFLGHKQEASTTELLERISVFMPKRRH